mmetsp:Transcript_55341/g.131437  ORF Transcript_55341/g.131437 Transcript_55341/m.131437 type:complete len:338 (+) Transcript_55341:134-1147(+)
MVAMDNSDPGLPSWLQGVISSKKIKQTSSLYVDGSDVREQLRDPSYLVRLSAARAISAWVDVPMNEDRENVLRSLISNSGERFGVRDEDVEVRTAAAEALGSMSRGSGDARVRDALLELLPDNDWTVRRAALRSLSAVSSQIGDEAVEQQLMHLFTSSDWRCRAVGAEGLELLCARGCVPRGRSDDAKEVLLAALVDEDWAVRKAAASALSKVVDIGDEACLRGLVRAGSRDADWRVRKQALLAVGDVAARGCEVAVGGLLLGLEDADVAPTSSALDISSRQDRDVRATAVRMLERVAFQGDQRVLAALRRCLAAENNLDHASNKFVEALEASLKDA